jgi:outer membrane biosynthesis protein TonB
VHNTTDNAQMDKAAQTISRTTQNSAHTAMDYALKTQEMNSRLLQQTSQAWIDGFRYQVKLSQGMAQVFFGQWGNALASMTPVALPVERQSRSEITEEPATNGVQEVSEPAAKDAQKDIEIAEKKAETQQAEKVARETRKAEEAAEETQKKTEIAAESAQKSAEPAAEETQKSTEVAAKDAQETQKSTEIAAKDAQKNTETAAFPIDGYDEMNVGEVSERLNGLSVDELKRVRKYEKGNKDRGTLRKEMEQKTETTS